MSKVIQIILSAKEIRKNTDNYYLRRILDTLIEYDEHIDFYMTHGIINPYSELYMLFYVLKFIIEDGFDIDTFKLFEKTTENLFIFLSDKKGEAFDILYENDNKIIVFAEIDNELVECENIAQAVILDNRFEGEWNNFYWSIESSEIIKKYSIRTNQVKLVTSLQLVHGSNCPYALLESEEQWISSLEKRSVEVMSKRELEMMMIILATMLFLYQKFMLNACKPKNYRLEAEAQWIKII